MRRMSRVVLHVVYVIDHWIIRHINIMVLHVTFPCKKKWEILLIMFFLCSFHVCLLRRIRQNDKPSKQHPLYSQSYQDLNDYGLELIGSPLTFNRIIVSVAVPDLYAKTTLFPVLLEGIFCDLLLRKRMNARNARLSTKRRRKETNDFSP